MNKPNIHQLVVGLILVGALSACAPNHRTVSNAEVEAAGSIITGQGSFSSITIGSPKSPIIEMPAFAIRLVDGTVLRPQDFPRIRNGSTGTRCPAPKDWPTGTECHRIEGATFYFRGNTVVGVRLAETRLEAETLNIHIGEIDGDEFWSLPLPELIFIRIFGEPSETQDRFLL